jgi:hypothetical protein
MTEFNAEVYWAARKNVERLDKELREAKELLQENLFPGPSWRPPSAKVISIKENDV